MSSEFDSKGARVSHVTSHDTDWSWIDACFKQTLFFIFILFNLFEIRNWQFN